MRHLPGWRRVVWSSETGSAGRWCIQAGSGTTNRMSSTNVNVLDGAHALGAEHHLGCHCTRSSVIWARRAPASKTLHRLQVSDRAARLRLGQDLACPRSAHGSRRMLALGCRAARALRPSRPSSLLTAAFGARRRYPQEQHVVQGGQRRRTSTRSSAKGAASPSPSPGLGIFSRSRPLACLPRRPPSHHADRIVLRPPQARERDLRGASP